MENSLKKYGDCRGCKHYSETRGQFGEIIMWCQKIGRYLVTPSQMFDKCTGKEPLDEAIQMEIRF